MGCGCGMSPLASAAGLGRWADGTWLKVHKILLDRLRGAGKIDWSKALIDSSFRAGGVRRGHRPQLFRGPGQAPGSKHHVITDANGIPLGLLVRRRPTSTTSTSWPRCSTPSPRWRGRSATRSRSPTPSRGDLGSRLRAPPPGLRDSASSRSCLEKQIYDQEGLGETLGRSSGRCPGSTRTEAPHPAMSVGRRSIRRSSPWPVSRSVLSILFSGFC